MKSFLFFPNSRKASANMWWIIIGAVIALVVMIVLMIMFTGKSTVLERGLLDCNSKGGKCIAEADVAKCDGTITTTFDCPVGSTGFSDSVGDKCCFGVEKKSTSQNE